MKTAVFYHCWLPNEQGLEVVIEQVAALKTSGLYAAADQILVGFNGDPYHSQYLAEFLPRAEIHHVPPHGEAATIQLLQHWLADKEHWAVCYHHTKSITHPPGGPYTNWRRCLQRVVIENWERCVEDLENGAESVGAHWVNPHPTQQYYAGNFWWANSDYLRALPPIDTQTVNGKSYEAEVWIGKVLPRRTRAVDYVRHPIMHCP